MQEIDDKYPTPVYTKRYGVLENYNDPPRVYQDFETQDRVVEFVFKQAGETIKIPIVIETFLPFKEQKSLIYQRLQEALGNN